MDQLTKIRYIVCRYCLTLVRRASHIADGSESEEVAFVR